MSDEVYHKLRAQLDTYALGFPASASGVEIEMLKALFTPDEAEINLSLTMMPAPVEVVAERMGRDPEELKGILDDMVRKGTIFKSLSSEGKICYHATPYMHGLAENIAGDQTPEMAKLFHQYEEETYLNHFLTVPLQNVVRFIPIEDTVATTVSVLPHNKAEAIIRSKTRIAAIPCFCRDKAKKVGLGCDKPMADACFMFDWIADYVVERGQGRYLSLDEALEIQRKFDEVGLVTMPSNLKDTMAMCHCCGDCCITIRAIKKAAKPVDFVTCDFYSQADPEVCTGCEICVAYCPMEAIVIDGPDGTARVNLDRCIGCGICISKCSADALKMHEKPDVEKKKGPVDVMEFITEMSKCRGLKANPFF